MHLSFRNYLEFCGFSFINNMHSWKLKILFRNDFYIFCSPWKMKNSVKTFLRHLWRKPRRHHSHTTAITTTIMDMRTRTWGTLSFQRISSQKPQILWSIPLLNTIITTINRRAHKVRVTQRTEICLEVKVPNFLFHKRSSDDDV